MQQFVVNGENETNISQTRSGVNEWPNHFLNKSGASLLELPQNLATALWLFVLFLCCVYVDCSCHFNSYFYLSSSFGEHVYSNRVFAWCFSHVRLVFEWVHVILACMFHYYIRNFKPVIYNIATSNGSQNLHQLPVVNYATDLCCRISSML